MDQNEVTPQPVRSPQLAAMRISTFAQRFEMSERQVRALISSGRLRAVKVGSHCLRILDADATAFIESCARRGGSRG